MGADHWEMPQDGGGETLKPILVSSPELDIVHTEPLRGGAWVAFRKVFARIALDPTHPHFVLHASAVTNGSGQTAVLVGASNCGKTSMLIGLLERGYRMACDDYSMITLEGGKLITLPVGVTVSRRTVQLFPSIKASLRSSCRFVLRREQNWTVNLAESFDICPAFLELDPTHFFFVHPNFGGSSRIEACDREQTLWKLQTGRFLSRSLTERLCELPLEHQERFFSLAQHLASTASFYTVLNGNIHDSVALVSEALEDPRAG